MFTFTPIDLCDGSSSLNKTRDSTLTSVQWRIPQSSDRSSGLASLLVTNTSKEVSLRFLLSSSLEISARMDSPVVVLTTVVARSGKMTRVSVHPPRSRGGVESRVSMVPFPVSVSKWSRDFWLQCSQKLIDFLLFVFKESVRLCLKYSSLKLQASSNSPEYWFGQTPQTEDIRTQKIFAKCSIYIAFSVGPHKSKILEAAAYPDFATFTSLQLISWWLWWLPVVGDKVLSHRRVLGDEILFRDGVAGARPAHLCSDTVLVHVRFEEPDTHVWYRLW